MNRVIALVLALVLCLSLFGCGGSNHAPATEVPTEKSMDKNDTSNYVGEWANEYFSLTITQGGVGRYSNLMNGTEQYDLDWEVKDEVLITHISFFGMEHKAVLELNEDGTVLSVIQMGFPVYVDGADTFAKK